MVENEKLYLKRAKKGDIEAFEILVQSHQKRIYNIALRLLGNREDAMDLAQEALIKMYKSISKFKEESSLSTWIYRITTNVCLDHLRKYKNKKEISIDEKLELDEGEVNIQIEDNSSRPDKILERNETKRIINQAIVSLSPDQRIVIVLKDIQGFSYEEISEYIKVPIGTVKSRLNRARLSLKEMLKKRLELLNDRSVK
ncbi:MAG: sigma-70 family RNA polymerase sigma factor [Clostridiales bacterium]